MASEPFSLQSSLTFAPDDGQPNAILDFAFGGQFAHKLVQKLELPASGTHVVGFGTIVSPGVKVVFLEYLNNASGLAPIQLQVNGGTDDNEVSPGGFWCICNPTPVGGLTELSIVHTSVGTVRVTLLG